MMTMSSLSGSLVASDPSKSAFLEFGHGYPGHQQHSPGLSHNHYPVHGLHPVGPSQHDSTFSSSASSYGRTLAYPYHSTVSAHHPSAYLPYQHSSHNNGLGHTRIEETGTFLKTSVLTFWSQFNVCCHFENVVTVAKAIRTRLTSKIRIGHLYSLPKPYHKPANKPLMKYREFLTYSKQHYANSART